MPYDQTLGHASITTPHIIVSFVNNSPLEREREREGWMLLVHIVYCSNLKQLINMRDPCRISLLKHKYKIWLHI